MEIFLAARVRARQQQLLKRELNCELNSQICFLWPKRAHMLAAAPGAVLLFFGGFTRWE